MDRRKKVVITGAGGGVVGRILPQLRERYDLVLLDLYNTDAEGNTIEGMQIVNMANRDREALRAYFKGADVVMHTAYTFSRRVTQGGGDGGDGGYQSALDDIQMAYNVYRLAQEEGIGRVVMFSSNQAANFYEQLIKRGLLETMDEDLVPYADNFYGWSKIAIESLGHLFAAGHVGKTGKPPIEVICVRLGAPRTDLIENVKAEDQYLLRRHFGSYLSEKDEIQLLSLCIDQEDVRDENGIPFLLVYGVSDNYNRLWSLKNARKYLGYAPESNSYFDFPERITELFNAHIEAGEKK